MNKIAFILSKWAFVIFLVVLTVALLFAIACCIYTAITNPFVGITGCVGIAVALAFVVGRFIIEIKEK